MRILIVEDNDGDYRLLESCIEKYYAEEAVDGKYSVTRFDNVESLLFGYKCDCDIIFMDIDLPGADGMYAAKRIRALDSAVVIVFITNMQRFAVKGYEVGALDFIVKPLHYTDFKLKFSRAERIVEADCKDKLSIRSEGKTVRVRASEIMYVEARGHYLRYKPCGAGGGYEVYGGIGEEETRLKKYGFLRCNRGYLVNTKYISEVANNLVTLINGEIVPIGKSLKKTFLRDLTVILGNG